MSIQPTVTLTVMFPRADPHCCSFAITETDRTVASLVALVGGMVANTHVCGYIEKYFPANDTWVAVGNTYKLLDGESYRFIFLSVPFEFMEDKVREVAQEVAQEVGQQLIESERKARSSSRSSGTSLTTSSGRRDPTPTSFNGVANIHDLEQHTDLSSNVFEQALSKIREEEVKNDVEKEDER